MEEKTDQRKIICFRNKSESCTWTWTHSFANDRYRPNISEWQIGRDLSTIHWSHRLSVKREHLAISVSRTVIMFQYLYFFLERKNRERERERVERKKRKFARTNCFISLVSLSLGFAYFLFRSIIYWTHPSSSHRISWQISNAIDVISASTYVAYK